MNKYQEAKAWIDKINAHPEWARCDFEEPALSQLTELVEKATHKKPILIKDSFDDFYQCSNCVRILNYKQKYCSSCGQAISWSQEEEDVD